MSTTSVTMAVLPYLLFISASVTAETTNPISYQGDRLTFPVNITATSDDGSPGDTCIPAGTPLRGLATNDTAAGIRVKVLSKTTDCASGRMISQKVGLTITKKTVELTRPDRYGWSYGTLAVPFKYHFTGSKDFTGSGTIGLYLGYRIKKETLGVAYEFVGFMGASNIAVTQSVNGEDTTQQLAGFSYGLGVLGTVKGDFQLGLVVGADRVSSNAGYSDNGKPWVAVSLGFSFQ